MSKIYGNTNKSTGTAKIVKEHPSPGPQADHFSNMAVVDAKEQHAKSLQSFAAKANHVKSMPISDHHAYKRQSHAVKPSGPINSFVSQVADLGKPLKVKQPKES